MKVEWPTKSQTLCTRKRFIYLCLIALILSLIQNITYTLLCFNDECKENNLSCEIFIHVIYIAFYMTIPIAIILVSISRTCLITLHIKKRFRTSTQRQIPTASISRSCKRNSPKNCSPTTENHIKSPAVVNRISNSFVNSLSTTTTTTNNTNTNHELLRNSQKRLANYTTHLRRKRSGLDTQMIILISINVAPFIIVHIITEIAYLFEKYLASADTSSGGRQLIILIYLSWYLISATRFYTNCLLSRIYREEFNNRLQMLRNGCKPRIILVGQGQSRRHSSRFYTGNIANAVESTFIPATDLKSFAMT